MVYSAVTQSRKEIQSILIRIITNSIQLNALAASCNIAWPTGASDIIKVQQTISQLASSFISIDCFLEPGATTVSAFYIKSMLFSVLPIFVIILPWLFFLPKYFYDSRNILGPAGPADEFEQSLQLATAWRMMYRQYVTSVIVLLFLLHPSLTQTTMFLFACMKIGPNPTDYYLLADLGEQCYTATYYKYAIGVGLPCLVFYVFGIPLMFFLILRYYQPVKNEEGDDDKKDDELNAPRKEIRVITNFLQSGYRAKYYYWEIVVMIRKTLVIVVIVYFNNFPLLQLLMGTLVTVCALLIHLKVFPYSIKTMNRFEFFSILTSFIVFYFGQFLASSDPLAPPKIVIGSFILLWFCGFFLAGAIFLVLIIYRNRRRRLAEESRRSLGKVVFEDDDDEDDDDEDDTESNQSDIQEKIKKAVVANLASENTVSIEKAITSNDPISSITTFETTNYQNTNSELFEFEQIPTCLRTVLCIDGVDMAVLEEDSNMSDFIEKIGDDLSATLGYSFERFTLHRVMPDPTFPDRVLIGLDINAAPINAKSVPSEMIFNELKEFISLPAEEKNAEMLTAFASSITKY